MDLLTLFNNYTLTQKQVKWQQKPTATLLQMFPKKGTLIVYVYRKMVNEKANALLHEKKQWPTEPKTLNQ